MTTSRTRKPTAKKAASATKEATPMDETAPEQETPETIVFNERDCYALHTLVSEVTDLFPEVTYETVGRNGRNVAVAVTFDAHESPSLPPLLALVEHDPRIDSVDYDQAEDSVLVQFINNPATYDRRDGYGLAQAHSIMTEGAEVTEPEVTEPEVTEPEVDGDDTAADPA